MKNTLSLVTVLLSLAASPALAVPTTVSFTGRILDSSSTEPISGPVSLNFKLYDALTGGTVVWEEDQSATAEDGMVYLALGRVKALDGTVFNGRALWLELTVNGDTMAPREAIQAVPYAIRAVSADSIANLAPAALQKRIAGSCAAGSSIRAIDDQGQVTCEIDDSSTYSALAGGGLTMSVANELSVDTTTTIQKRVSTTCTNSGALRAISADGTASCQALVAPAAGLVAAGTFIAPTLGVDTTATGIVAVKNGAVNQSFDSGTLYLDYANNRVGVNNVSPAVALDVTGAVTASGNATAANFTTAGTTGAVTSANFNYSPAKTRYLNLPAAAFQTDYESRGLLADGYRYSGYAGAWDLYAPVNLPAGASVSRLECYIYDSGNVTYSGSINFKSRYFNADPVAQGTATFATVGAPGHQIVSTDFVYTAVDNLYNSYYVHMNGSLDAVPQTACGFAQCIRFYGCRLTYTVTSAD